MAEQTEKSFPWDAEEINGEYDRRYLAEDFTRYFRAFISSGTFMKESTNLQVMSNGDMTVTLMPGSMIIEGTRYDNTKDLVFELTPADGVLNRIDRIAIVYDKQQRDIHAEILEGEPSYKPVPKSIRRTEEYKDYITADIYVAAGVVSIQQEDITDQRLNSEVCGIAVPFTEIDTTTIFNQFLDWFEQIKSDGEKDVQQLLDDLRGLLDEDVAVHLQSEIDKINEEMKNKISSSDVVDNYESKATDLPLSANKGSEMYEKLSPKQFEYTYSSDIQTDVKNCIEKAIALYGTDIALNAFWVSKNTENINAYSGMITLTSNLSKLAIRIEGTYVCSAINKIITFLYNVNDKIFISFNDGQNISIKISDEASGTGSSVSANGTVAINITIDVPTGYAIIGLHYVKLGGAVFSVDYWSITGNTVVLIVRNNDTTTHNNLNASVKAILAKI